MWDGGGLRSPPSRPGTQKARVVPPLIKLDLILFSVICVSTRGDGESNDLQQWQMLGIPTSPMVLHHPHLISFQITE